MQFNLNKNKFVDVTLYINKMIRFIRGPVENPKKIATPKTLMEVKISPKLDIDINKKNCMRV